ncbi:hypothetical protein SEA_JACKO_83 [Microbacterium phage Jacko]|nr:hypothetical protein SEA_JACKO_83 [Microbacterium phage Jacko]
MSREGTQASRDLGFLTGFLHGAMHQAERKMFEAPLASEAKRLAALLQREGFARPDTVES